MDWLRLPELKTHKYWVESKPKVPTDSQNRDWTLEKPKQNPYDTNVTLMKSVQEQTNDEF